MKYKILFFSLITIFIQAGCNNNHPGDRSVDKGTAAKEYEKNSVVADSTIVKVYIDNTGHITANERAVSLNELTPILNNLKKNKGSVYYSRDNTQADSSGEYLKVMDLIIQAGLPVKFYTDKTFSRTCKNELFCG